jgi:phenylalanyl-tRNA synthetase beta chain
MKFTLSWLKRHLETSATLDEIVQALTMTGIEVEGVEDPGAKLAAFSVARIVEAVQHPNADRLRVCQVDTRDGRKEIVCGAPNARAGLVTIYAPLGTYIPGSGITLEARPVRGVVSNGMLCSGAELEVDADADGILELTDTLAVGTPAAEALGLADPVIDVEVTPNRPDWLGVAGIARDLAAAGLGRLITPKAPLIDEAFDCPVAVRTEAPEACPVFAGRLIRGVRNGPSPAWLQSLLRAVGLRPINALVDVTNFISRDRARPLHVYDAGKLTGGIVARLGRAGESLAALDGKTYAVTDELCVIADDSGAIGFGGVMGGASTGCDEATTDVFIESAWFDPARTYRAGRITGIDSDARRRFERGVDTGFVMGGLDMATAMVLELCGGAPSSVVLAGAVPPPPPAIRFPYGEAARLSGMDVTPRQIDALLEATGFNVTPDGDAATVLPPTWRRDIEGPADIVEDIVRLHGFEKLPRTSLPALASRQVSRLTPLQARARLARRTLAAQGWQEAVTWSFAAQKQCALFGGGSDALVLANPIAAELDCMRPSALIHLLAAGQRNANRGFPASRLFEVGPIYLGDQPGDQRLVAAGAARGLERSWQGAAAADIFSVKGDLIALLETLGVNVAGLMQRNGARDWWHPGRSGTLSLGPKTVVAEFGELHPRVLKALDIEGPVVGFELVLDALPPVKAKATKTKPKLDASDLMPLSRDFAFVAPDTLAAGDLTRAIAGVDKALISGVSLFDVYRGKGVPEGSASLAVEVRLQPRERTLTDADIEAVSAKVVAAAAKLGATLRA